MFGVNIKDAALALLMALPFLVWIGMVINAANMTFRIKILHHMVVLSTILPIISTYVALVYLLLDSR